MAANGEDAPNLDPAPLRLPSYPEMILEAIAALHDAKGSNKTAISGYIRGKYGAGLAPAHASLLTAHLARMKAIGEVAYSRNSYFRPDDGGGGGDELRAPPPPPDPDATNGAPDVASVLAADEDGAPAPTPAVDLNSLPAPAPAVGADATAAPVKRGRGRPPKRKGPVAVPAAEAPGVTAPAVDVPVKRGRGRPPKRAKADREAPARVPVPASAAAADANVVPTKRGRGRPPKVKPPVDGEAADA